MLGPVISSRLGPVTRCEFEIKIVGDEAPFARLFHPLLDHGMARGDSLEHRLLSKLRPHITARCGQMRKAGQQVRLGHGCGSCGGCGLPLRSTVVRSSAKMRFSISMQRSCAVRILRSYSFNSGV